jgi:hypothetical protein
MTFRKLFSPDPGPLSCGLETTQRKGSHGILPWFAVLGLICSGCASYAYKAQSDSAFVTAPSVSGVAISVDHIDGFTPPYGMRAGFVDGPVVVPVSPGIHKLDVSLISNSTTRIGPHEGNEMVGGGVVEYDFKASDKYRIAASYGDLSFSVTLWDDTGAVAQQVGQWTFKGS